MLRDKVKIGVMVSGGGTNLQALIDAQKSGIIESGEIVLVLSNKADAYALERGKAAGIATEVVLKSECKDSEEFEARLIDALEKAQVELIVLAGFMSILSKNFTDKYKNRILNVHPSLPDPDLLRRGLLRTESSQSRP